MKTRLPSPRPSFDGSFLFVFLSQAIFLLHTNSPQTSYLLESQQLERSSRREEWVSIGTTNSVHKILVYGYCIPLLERDSLCSAYTITWLYHAVA
jgi:hypothetical protein